MAPSLSRSARAAVGQPMRGARLAPGSNRPVYFGGSAAVTIPPGGRVTSDPVPLAVRAGQDLAVSLHVPGAGVRPSRHRSALTTLLPERGRRG